MTLSTDDARISSSFLSLFLYTHALFEDSVSLHGWAAEDGHFTSVRLVCDHPGREDVEPLIEDRYIPKCSGCGGSTFAKFNGFHTLVVVVIVALSASSGDPL